MKETLPPRPDAPEKTTALFSQIAEQLENYHSLEPREKEAFVSQVEAICGKDLKTLNSKELEQILDTLDQQDSERVINTIVQNYDLRGTEHLTDTSGNELEIEFLNPPIAKDANAGYVLRYRLVANYGTKEDQKTGKPVKYYEGKELSSIRINSIQTFVEQARDRQKVQRPHQMPKAA